MDSSADIPSQSSSISVVESALTLHLSITERAGKHVVDGYFSQTEPVTTAGEPLWSDDENTCIRQPDIDTELAATNDTPWMLERSARRIDISTREGLYVSLLAQQSGSTIVYAGEDRWVSEPIPEDAVLHVTGTDGAMAISSALSPLPPLQRLSTESGRLTDDDTSLQWQVVSGSDDRIELRLSAVGARQKNEFSPALVMVECSLADDGLFELPEALLKVVGELRYVNVGMARYRQRRFELEDGNLSIVQRSVN